MFFHKTLCTLCILVQIVKCCLFSRPSNKSAFGRSVCEPPTRSINLASVRGNCNYKFEEDIHCLRTEVHTKDQLIKLELCCHKYAKLQPPGPSLPEHSVVRCHRLVSSSATHPSVHTSADCDQWSFLLTRVGHVHTGHTTFFSEQGGWSGTGPSTQTPSSTEMAHCGQWGKSVKETGSPPPLLTHL